MILAEFPFELMAGSSYVVVATGLLGDNTTPFDLVATSTTFGASSVDVVGLEVYHGSTDAPAVDVLADANEGSVLVPGLAYGSFSGYVEVPAADYTLGVAPSGSDAIAAFTAPLSGLGGGSAVAFASGFLAPAVVIDPAFGVFAALADGTVLELPALVQDCAGTWGGDSVEDDCGVCDGGNADMDCSGECGGSAVIDECGVCGGDGTSCVINIDFSLANAVDGSVDVFMSNTHPVQGFQFNITGMVLESTVVTSGGSAEVFGEGLQVGPNGVLGADLTGYQSISPGNGLLTSLSGASFFDALEVCLVDLVVSVDGEGFQNITSGYWQRQMPLQTL